MNTDLIGNTSALATILPLLLVFFIGARMTPQGAISLPCILALTSIVYFYLLPLLVLSVRDDGFFGLFLTDMQWAYYVVLLYAAGALAAIIVNLDVFAVDPAAPQPKDKEPDRFLILFFWAVTAAGISGLVATNQLSIFEQQVEILGGGSQYLFLNQSLNLMVPLTLLFLIRRNFSPVSLLIVPLVLFLFLQVGFRFRIMILLAGIATSYASMRGIRIRTSHALIGLCIGLALAVTVGALRSYGRGVDFSRLGDSFEEAAVAQLVGECGTVYVLSSIAGATLPDPIYLEPWLLGIIRLIPTFVWPEKPASDYLGNISNMMALPGGDKAGVAAPQHVEMLLQFGWVGLPFLAFGYFLVIARILKTISHLGRDARIAGYSIAPVFFGYYMQTRGYFFQIFTDGLFMFGPLFVLHMRVDGAPSSVRRAKG
jgi:hypothetical protein